MPLGQGLVAHVLHPHRQVGLGGDELGDAAAHHAGAEHADGRVDLPRRGAGRPVASLGLLGEPEDVDQILRRPRGGELGHGAGLGVETGARPSSIPTRTTSMARSGAG